MARNSIAGLKWAMRYYCCICMAPFPTSVIPKYWRRCVLLPLYILTRVTGISKLIYQILLIFGCFNWKHGRIDTLGVLEAILWAFGMLPYLGADILLLNREFLRNVDKFYVTMLSILEDTSHFLQVTTASRNSASFKTWRFMIFAVILDTFQCIFTFYAMVGAMTEQSQVYSVLPWRNDFLENILWFLESFNIAVILVCISMMTTLPGAFAYYMEECLRKMTNAIVEATKNGVGSNRTVVWRMLDQYRKLFYITRELNKVIGWGAMTFNTTNSVQQIAETYVIFQSLRAGSTLAVVWFLLTDIFVREI